MTSDLPAPGLDHFPAHDLFQAVVAPFDQEIGLERGDQLQGGVFAEQHHPVHAGQRGQQRGPVPFRVDGAGRVLYPGA